jgi:hypothetical protein
MVFGESFSDIAAVHKRSGEMPSNEQFHIKFADVSYCFPMIVFSLQLLLAIATGLVMTALL